MLRIHLLSLMVFIFISLTKTEKYQAYRSQCRRDVLFKGSNRDQILTGTPNNLISFFFSESLSLCARECGKTPNCTSLNYKANWTSNQDKNCQILSITKNSSAAVFSGASGWIHYEPVSQTGPRCRLVTCSAGYSCVETCDVLSGYRCIDVNECSSNPCQNGGSCVDGINQYTCNCASGYSGLHCTTVSRKSCRDFYLAGSRANGVYNLVGESGTSFDAYCDMGDQGWTLIARFSNKDAMNWMQNSGAFWYDQQVFGAPTSPSANADMISRAFFDVKGSDVKISRSDISSHAFLLYAGTCLSQQTFRDKLTSYGNFRNNARWLPSNDGCRGHCTIHSYGAKTGVSGFSQSACSGTVQSSNQLGFWCHYGSGDGAVLMIGGGGNACGRADHGIGITEANAPQFDVASGAKDFGDNNAGSSVYSLNLWIR